MFVLLAEIHQHVGERCRCQFVVVRLPQACSQRGFYYSAAGNVSATTRAARTRCCRNEWEERNAREEEGKRRCFA